jgi:hypothetical protein
MRSVGASRQDRAQDSLVCDWCGQVTPANYVHGHIQCLHCHRNIAPCCDGEVCTPGPAGNAKDA